MAIVITFVVELQSNSLQRWLRVRIRSVSVAFLYFIFPTFYGENFQTYRKIEMVIVDICTLPRLSSKFLQFTIFALFTLCVHSWPFFLTDWTYDSKLLIKYFTSKYFGTQLLRMRTFVYIPKKIGNKFNIISYKVHIFSVVHRMTVKIVTWASPVVTS